jgi:hypothetical protein
MSRRFWTWAAWVASVALFAFAIHRLLTVELTANQLAWTLGCLAVGVVCMATAAWRSRRGGHH